MGARMVLPTGDTPVAHGRIFDRGIVMNAEHILAMRAQAVAQMESLLATSGPTITVGGEEMAWAPLLAALERTVDWCDRKLGEYEPFEVRSQGTT